MKKLYIILTSVIALLAFSACKETAEEQVSPESLRILRSALDIPAKGGNAIVALKANGPLDIKLDQDWCTISNQGDSLITLVADANTDFESRYAKATFTCGDESEYVTIQQYGFLTSGFAPQDINVSASAAVVDLPYSYEDPITASTNADWVALEITEDNLKVSIAENTTKATSDNKSRTCEINWTLGIESGVIKVTQINLDFMQEDANWTVTYGGESTYQGSPCSLINVEVKNPGVSGKYIIAYTDKSDVGSAETIASYVESTLGPEIQAELAEVIDYYISLGATVTYADFLSEESDSGIFDPFENGDYYGFAIGMDDNGELTGHFAYCAFTVKNGDTPTTGYEAWLGEWEAKRGSTSEVWTITEKVKGKTYTVTGLENTNKYPFEAEFDSSSNMLVIRSQSGLGTLSHKDGDIDVCIYGGYNGTSLAVGEYIILTASFNGKTATLTPENANTSAYQGPFEGFRYYGYQAATDKYYRITSMDTFALPATITKKSGGEDGGGEGSGTFSKWLGSWNVKRGSDTDTWSISSKVADKTLLVSGIEGDPANVGGFEAAYNADETFTLTTQSELIEMTTSYGTAVISLYGQAVLSDGEEYIITPGGDEYEIFTAKLKSNTSASLTPGRINIQGEGEFDLSSFGFFGELIDGDYVGQFLSFSEYATPLPADISKSSSKSNGKALSLTNPDNWKLTDMKSVRMERNYVEVKAYKNISRPDTKHIGHISK